MLAESPKSLLLLSGIPATGKSYFGQWLEQYRDFLHIDAEKDGRLKALDLESVWLDGIRRADANSFVQVLRRLNRYIAFEWGFPTQCLPFVEALKRDGFTLWWFDADHSVARDAFIQRGGVSIQAFDKQITDIAQDWQKIRSVFTPNVLRALDSKGVRLSPTEICSRMNI